MKIIKVAITSAGAGPAIAVIKALRAQKKLPVEVIAMDMDITAPGLYLADKYVLVPPVKADNFIDFTLNYCTREKIDFLIPIFDLETPVFAKNIDRFKKIGVDILVNDYDVILKSNEKKSTHSHCLEHNILVPRIYSKKEINSGEIRFPLIVKPNLGIGSKGIQIISSEKELEFLEDLFDDYLFQKYIEGPEYTIDTVSNFKSTCIAALPRERIVVKAGQTVKGKVVADKRLIAFGKRVADVFRLKGVGCIQCKIKDGKIYLIEINPRYGTGLSLSVGAGLNLPLLHLKLALNKKISKKELEFKDGFFMTRYWEEIFLDTDCFTKTRRI